nr:hypothetical protein [Tanacetum cinerariifolium]
LAQGQVEGRVGLGGQRQHLPGGQQRKEAPERGGLVGQGIEAKHLGAGLVVGRVEAQLHEVADHHPAAAGAHLGGVAKGLLHGRFGAALGPQALLGVE